MVSVAVTVVIIQTLSLKDCRQALLRSGTTRSVTGGKVVAGAGAGAGETEVVDGGEEFTTQVSGMPVCWCQ